MAYSPCPKCQTKEEFDNFFAIMTEAEAIEAAGFAVMEPGFRLKCNRNPDHHWETSEGLHRDLAAAGYTGRRALNVMELPGTAPKRKPVRYERGPIGLLFDILFPESENFRCKLLPEAKHCLHRSMCHLRGDLKNTYPSTKDGVPVPGVVWND